MRQWEEAEAASGVSSPITLGHLFVLAVSSRRVYPALSRRPKASFPLLRCSFVLSLTKQGIDARLREAETELSAARRLLHEAGAERELLRLRLKDARKETEDVLQGFPQQVGFFVGFDPLARKMFCRYCRAAATGRESLLRERELRENAESLCAQLRAAMNEQIELDAEALERMDEWTLQARTERDAITLEKDRLQDRVGDLEKGKHDAESALSAARDELEEACRDLEDVGRRLARSRRDHAAAMEQLDDARRALAAAREELAETKRALAAAHQALAETTRELSSARQALSGANQELSGLREELEAAAAARLGESAGEERLRVVEERLAASERERALAGERLVLAEAQLAELTERPKEGKRKEDTGGPVGTAERALLAEAAFEARAEVEALRSRVGEAEQEASGTRRSLSEANRQLASLVAVARAQGGASAASAAAAAVASHGADEAMAADPVAGGERGAGGGDRTLQRQLERANQLRAAAEEKAASFLRRLAEVKAEADLIVLAAERAEEGKDYANGEEGEGRSRTGQELQTAMDAQARLEERLAQSQLAKIAAETLAAERAGRLSALEESNRSLERELGVREMAVAAAQSEASRFESKASEAEAAATELKERLSEVLRQAETAAAEAEAARMLAAEAQKALEESNERLRPFEAEHAASTQRQDFLENKVVELQEQVDEGFQRELQRGKEQRRLEHLLQETRVEADDAAAAAAASSSAEREAADRGAQERRRRETAEAAAAEAEERAAEAEAACVELREEADRLNARLKDAQGREAEIRGLLAQMEELGAGARRQAEEAREEAVELRAELLEARRRVEDGEAEVRELQAQVSDDTRGISRVAGAREQEERAREELSASRSKAEAEEEKARVASREAETQERSLRNQLQVSQSRAFELEARVSSLTAANGRLSRYQDALVDDAFQAEDLLCAAADGMRRSRTAVSTGPAGRSTGRSGNFAAAAAAPRGERRLRSESPDFAPASLRAGDLASPAGGSAGLFFGDGGGRGEGGQGSGASFLPVVRRRLASVVPAMSMSRGAQSLSVWARGPSVEVHDPCHRRRACRPPCRFGVTEAGAKAKGWGDPRERRRWTC
ncbi:unnamed protein product [Scytosiphon promiscuus]